MNRSDNSSMEDSMTASVEPLPDEMKPQKTTSGYVSLSLMTFVILFILLLLRSQTAALNDPDTLMHITIGKWILQNGSVPDHDVFSFTRSGAPWVPHEWLSDIVLYLVHYTTGWAGLIVMSVVCATTSLAYLFRFMLDRSVPAVYALILLIVSATSLLNHLLARPHILVWPILVVWVGTLIKSNEQKEGPPYSLLVLMMLWANMHGSYILGLAILLPLALEGIRITPIANRHTCALRWLVFVALAGLVTLVTPYGWHGYRLIFELLSQPTLTTIVEWSAADFSQINAIEIWIFVLLCFMGLGMLQLPLIRLVILLCLLYEALTHVRYFSIFGLLVPLLIALPFAQQYRVFSKRIGRSYEPYPSMQADFLAPVAIPKIIVASIGLILFAWAVSAYNRPEPPKNIMPVAAVDAALNAGLANSPVFHDFGYGGYLIYRGVPVYVDGRADMYGSEFIADYNRLSEPDRIDDFEKMLDQKNIVWTLLPLDSRFARVLENRAGWSLLFKDADNIAYRRSSVR